MQDLTGGRQQVSAAGETVRAVIDDLERQFPGLRRRVCDAEGLRAGMAISIDGEIATTGLAAPVREESEVHFLPAISGGTPQHHRDTETRSDELRVTIATPEA